MLLITLATVFLWAQPGVLREGVFVGTFVSASGNSLVVQADNGGAVGFLIDPESDVPAGFVPGTRVSVRFELLEDRRYRAASVSPPRIPFEPDAVTVLPLVQDSGPAQRNDVGAAVRADVRAPVRADVSAPAADRGLARPGSAPSRGAGVQQVAQSVGRPSSASSLPVSTAAAPSADGAPEVRAVAMAKPTATANPPAGGPQTGSGAAATAALVAAAALAWWASRLVV